MAESQLATETFPRRPARVVDTGQLFPAEPVASEIFSHVIDGVSARDKTWVTFNEHGRYETIGGQTNSLERPRALLRRAFAIYMPSPFGHKPTDLASQLEVGGSLESTINLLERIEETEEMISKVPEPDTLPTFEEEIAALRKRAETRRDRSFVRSVLNLNRFIQDDPSDIMLGVVDGDNKKPLVAKVTGVYVGKSHPQETRRAVFPILAGEDGEPGRLPDREGVFAYGVYIEASYKGRQQVAANRREREEFSRSIGK